MSDECDLYFLLYIAFKNWLKRKHVTDWLTAHVNVTEKVNN